VEFASFGSIISNAPLTLVMDRLQKVGIWTDEKSVPGAKNSVFARRVSGEVVNESVLPVVSVCQGPYVPEVTAALQAESGCRGGVGMRGS
jgi:hypothetical protein